MEGTTSNIPLRIRQKAETGHTPLTANADVGGKPSALANDDWLVAFLSSLWHSRGQSAQMRDIVESNVDPEEADIAHNLFLSIPWGLRILLQNQTTLYLESLGDSMGQYLPGWLDELRAGPLLPKCTSSILSMLKASVGSSLLTSRTVTERATTEGQGSAESEVMGYALQEEHTNQNSPFIWFMYKLSGHHNPWTNLVMALLENIAANEEAVSMASGGLSYYDHGKFKHD